MEILQFMALMTIFPYAALFVSMVFVGLYFFRKKKVSLWVAGFWMVYFAYELLMYFRITCAGECNIRVDLIVVYPALLFAAVVGVVVQFYPMKSED